MRRVIREFPQADPVLRIGGAPDAANRKVSSLVNMFPAARHDLIVVAVSRRGTECGDLR